MNTLIKNILGRCKMTIQYKKPPFWKYNRKIHPKPCHDWLGWTLSGLMALYLMAHVIYALRGLKW